MASLRIVVFALLAGLSHGDSCEQPTFRLSSQEDATTLGRCQTFKGDVVIAATAKGTIDLDGIQKISGSLSNERCFDGANEDKSTQSILDGDLSAWKNCDNLESFSSSTLAHVTGDVTLRSLVGLKTFDIRNLKAVNGTLRVEYLPGLQLLNLSKLELVENLFLRHNRQLVNLTMPQLSNVTAKESSVELVDLAIWEWPRIKIRIHEADEAPRRLERLVAKGLPNISLFEFNNADEIGLLEAHGLENQTVQLTTNFQPTGPTPASPFTSPVSAIDNLTLTGFVGSFGIDSEKTIDVKQVTIQNSAFTGIGLNRIAKTQSLRIDNNPNVTYFSMPGNMESMKWQSIEFTNNQKLSWDLERVTPVGLKGWDWGFNTSTLTIQNSPISSSWLERLTSKVTRVKDRLDFAPSGNVSEVCGAFEKRAKEGQLVFPEGGYTCGGEKYNPKVNGASMSAVPSWLSVLVVVASIAAL